MDVNFILWVRSFHSVKSFLRLQWSSAWRCWLCDVHRHSYRSIWKENFWNFAPKGLITVWVASELAVFTILLLYILRTYCTQDSVLWLFGRSQPETRPPHAAVFLSESKSDSADVANHSLLVLVSSHYESDPCTSSLGEGQQYKLWLDWWSSYIVWLCHFRELLASWSYEWSWVFVEGHGCTAEVCALVGTGISIIHLMNCYKNKDSKTVLKMYLVRRLLAYLCSVQRSDRTSKMYILLFFDWRKK